MKVGFGKDIHILNENCPLILGGVKIPSIKGLVSYSDGDIVIHALIDAILGALGYGDIGEYFPNIDENKNKSSVIFLNKINEILKASSYRISNIDILIIIEKPSLKDHKQKIKENLSNLLEINKNNINIKAATNEKLDSIGKGDAAECDVVVLLEEK